MTRTASSAMDTLMTLDSPYDPDTLARIAWATIASPGDRYACHLIQEHGTIEALEHVFNRGDAVADLAANRLRMNVGGDLPVTHIAATLMETLAQRLTVVTPTSRCWPAGLNDLTPAAPFALWVQGDPGALQRPGIMVVGAEQMSPSGLHACLDFVSQWAQLGYTIYSSAGNGIPTVALLAALAVDGSAVTVLPTSHCTPVSGALGRIYGRLAERGAVVSELAPCPAERGAVYARRTWVTVAAASAVVVVDPPFGTGMTGTEDYAGALGRWTGIVGPDTCPQPSGGLPPREHFAVPIIQPSDIAQIAR